MTVNTTVVKFGSAVILVIWATVTLYLMMGSGSSFTFGNIESAGERDMKIPMRAQVGPWQTYTWNITANSISPKAILYRMEPEDVELGNVTFVVVYPLNASMLPEVRGWKKLGTYWEVKDQNATEYFRFERSVRHGFVLELPYESQRVNIYLWAQDVRRSA